MNANDNIIDSILKEARAETPPLRQTLDIAATLSEAVIELEAGAECEEIETTLDGDQGILTLHAVTVPAMDYEGECIADTEMTLCVRVGFENAPDIAEEQRETIGAIALMQGTFCMNVVRWNLPYSNAPSFARGLCEVYLGQVPAQLVEDTVALYDDLFSVRFPLSNAPARKLVKQ